MLREGKIGTYEAICIVLIAITFKILQQFF
jgi:hypothetical protein